MRGESHEIALSIHLFKAVLIITMICIHRNVNEALVTQKTNQILINNIYIVSIILASIFIITIFNGV